MSHLEPEWFECDYWRVETRYGTSYVPCEDCPNPADPMLLSMIDTNGHDVASEDIHLEHGWLGRLSASGYLDCTDYMAAETENGIKHALAEMYDLCEECLGELDEEYECPLHPSSE